MDAGKMAGICLQLVQAFTGNGPQQDMRAVIQDEIRRTSNREQNDMLHKMMQIIEQKHKAELQETARERDTYKIEAELLKQQMKQLMKEQKSTEKQEKLTQILTMMSEMNINQTQPKSHHQKPYNKIPQQRQSTRQDNLLPWCDNPKVNNSQKHAGENQAKPMHFKNNLQTDTGETSDNSKYYKNYNQQKSFEHTDKPYYEKKFTNNNASGASCSNFRGAPRGQQYRGRGQARGRSQSLGRPNKNKLQYQQEDQAAAVSATYNVQVTKVASSGNGNEADVSQINAAQQGRGRGNLQGRGRGAGRGHGRGRGRGRGNFKNQGNSASGGNASWEMVNNPENFQEKIQMNKNRRGNRQTQHKEHVSRREKNVVGEPEDNCVVM